MFSNGATFLRVIFLTFACEDNLSKISDLSTMRRGISKLSEWSFSESLLATLPADKEHGNLIRSHIPNVIFSHIRPTPFVTKPKIVAVSSDVLRNILDMDPERIQNDDDFVEWVSGNKVLDGSTPMAHRYGGYQFGSWANQLGDGRAHLLGEYVNKNGERWEIQLKGSGRTPYSRFGDGRAVLRSSVREFLCSEAMHFLGVPTSRAASLVLTEDMIIRDVMYNGKPTMEPCAVVMRVAPTWFRIGSLEILARHGELDELRQLLDFIVTNIFPDIKANNSDPDDQILELYSRIVHESARLVACWMSVGFAHGVLNTDNLSLKSITIDYGPFGFLDSYDPYFIPNHSDDSGRYDYESQPEIVRWNLKKLLQSLLPILSESKKDRLQEIIGLYSEIYSREWTELFCKKLGITFHSSNLKSDEGFARGLLNAMYSTGADFTQTFRDLSELSMVEMIEAPEKVCSDLHWGFAKVRGSKQFSTFLKDYKQRLESEYGPSGNDEERQKRMKASNPRYILRNWIAQRAIEAADKGDFSEVNLVLKVLGTPFDFQPEAEAAGYSRSVPDWGKHLIVSCSS